MKTSSSNWPTEQSSGSKGKLELRWSAKCKFAPWILSGVPSANRGSNKFSWCLNSGGLREKREDGNPKAQSWERTKDAPLIRVERTGGSSSPPFLRILTMYNFLGFPSSLFSLRPQEFRHKLNIFGLPFNPKIATFWLAIAITFVSTSRFKNSLFGDFGSPRLTTL